MHIERAGSAGADVASGYGERAETYVRLLAEAALRPADSSGAGRVRRAAEILVEADVLSDQAARQILTGLEVALRVRGRPRVRAPGVLLLGRLTGFRSSLTAGHPGSDQQRTWRLVPAGPATPGSRLMALVLTDDRALAAATLYFPAAVGAAESGVPPFAELTGTDNLGTRYRLGLSDGTWAGSAWTGTVMFHPAPPDAARWLAISSPNGQLLRADIPTAPYGHASSGMVLEPSSETPGERLLTRRAEAMLAAFPLGRTAGLTQPSLAETVATLEAAGALSPLSPAPARLAALGQLLGLPMEGPADRVPPRWTDVAAYYGRRRRLTPVTGTAAIGAELPELDGARFLIAGIRSGGSGTYLHVFAAGLRPMPRRRPEEQPVDIGFSWWVRDDAGGWHLGAFEDVSPVGGPEVLLRIALLPPLHHATTALTVQVCGTVQQVTAHVPACW